MSRRHEHKLRNEPTQARSRARLRRVLDAADEVLATEGADVFTTTRYWSDFEDLVAGAAEADALESLPDAGTFVIDILAAGFRARPGFLALWYGGLRTEAVRDATRPTRQAIAASIERILAHHWPEATPAARTTAAQMAVLAGDGLLREAFRRDRRGDRALLEESKLMLRSYLAVRLGEAGG
jgi:hypothetical protein